MPNRKPVLGRTRTRGAAWATENVVTGAPAVIAGGLSAYRPNASGTFVAAAPTLLGARPGYA